MTVYAVYTYYYTVTLQGGAGYTLTAETGSESPVKEGGSFTFRFALEKGYQRTKNFAVKVNGDTVELTAAEPYTYTISDIRENKTITVECNAALCSRRKKHFIFDSINTITAPSFR